MSKNNREDFSAGRLDYTSISLLSNKIKVLIIGGGRAGYIKAKSFLKKGCNVVVMALEFTSQFDNIKTNEKLQLVNKPYSKEYILDKQIIVIAVEEGKLEEEIIKDCEEANKLYLTCSDYKKGTFTMSVQGETEETLFTVQTKRGNPKASLFLEKVIRERLKEYDDFIYYLFTIREKLKGTEEREEILDFINSEDFFFFYKKGVQEEILKMFYGGIDFEADHCN